jgi:hypothetical protein
MKERKSIAYELSPPLGNSIIEIDSTFLCTKPNGILKIGRKVKVLVYTMNSLSSW